MKRRPLLASAMLMAVAMGALPAASLRTPQEDKQRIRRELDETRGHQERLRRAAEKRARKSAARAKQVRRN